MNPFSLIRVLTSKKKKTTFTNFYDNQSVNNNIDCFLITALIRTVITNINIINNTKTKLIYLNITKSFSSNLNRI